MTLAPDYMSAPSVRAREGTRKSEPEESRIADHPLNDATNAVPRRGMRTMKPNSLNETLISVVYEPTGPLISRCLAPRKAAPDSGLHARWA